MSIEAKLAELGLILPAAPKPVAAYVPCVRTGNLVFVSGQLPFAAGKPLPQGVIMHDLARAGRIRHSGSFGGPGGW